MKYILKYNKLYYFTLDSCKILQLFKDFNNNSLIFSPDGKKMMVKDTNNFIMVNINNNNNEEENEESTRKNYEINMKVEENYLNDEKEGNVDNNLNEIEIENNNEEEENEEMDEQIKESSDENKMNDNIAFEEEIGMNPDS